MIVGIGAHAGGIGGSPLPKNKKWTFSGKTLTQFGQK